MAFMDGFEAAAIRKKKKTLPIVALTAHAVKGYKDACLKAGMDSYISKPIRPNGLWELLNNIEHNHLILK